MQLYDVTVNNQKQPIGLDATPVFSWKIKSKDENLMQKSYRIQVFQAERLIWDSLTIQSDCSQHIQYEGPELLKTTQYTVEISVEATDLTTDTRKVTFETGLLVAENWQGEWITHEFEKADTTVPIFVTHWHKIKKSELVRARAYVTACGVYEVTINGDKVGDAFLAPGWTSYAHRLEYQTYDITGNLKETNEIAITVGNGWYKGDLGFDMRPNHYGDQVGIRAMFVAEFADGSQKVLSTNGNWAVFKGSIQSSEIYHGEVRDYTKLIANKEYPTLQLAEKKSQATLFHPTTPIGNLVSQESEFVRITKRFPVKEKIITPKGELVLDFGQNLSGLVEICLPPLTGEKLVIHHAESLDREGNFYTHNLRLAKCTDTYIYDETMVDHLVIPSFTFHGFRYICIEGVSEDVEVERFTSCSLHTDMIKTGSFKTNNPLVNQLQSNIEWGQRSNFLDIPTDCPQRDERLGWTGDAQVFTATASYNFDTQRFFRKWLRDVYAETNSTYGVPHVVPNILGDQSGASAWSDVVTITPWNLYQTYGDESILAEAFPSMKIWVDYMTERTSDNHLWMTGFQYGDWLALDIENGSIDRTGGTDKYLVANAYYAYSTKLTRDTAKVLKDEESYQKYDRLYRQIITAIQAEFVTKNGRLVSETQTACILMLYFDLIQPEFREKTLQTLVQNIGAHRNHLTTGFVGTPYICHCLSEMGEHEVAQAIFLKEDLPSWFYAIKKGATTIWERWNSILPDGQFEEAGNMNSLNHYAYGSIGEWLYRKVAGINMAAPGYKKIRIEPFLTLGMTEVSASYESVYGLIRSEWSCKDGKLELTVEIPANTTAEIILPDNNGTQTVGSGVYHYSFDTTISLIQEKYTFESTLGDIVANEQGKELLNTLSPGMLDNPMIEYAYDMTINELIGQAADAKPLFAAVMTELNKQA